MHRRVFAIYDDNKIAAVCFRMIKRLPFAGQMIRNLFAEFINVLKARWKAKAERKLADLMRSVDSVPLAMKLLPLLNACEPRCHRLHAHFNFKLLWTRGTRNLCRRNEAAL